MPTCDISPIGLLVFLFAFIGAIHLGRKYPANYTPPRGLTGQVDTQPY